MRVARTVTVLSIATACRAASTPAGVPSAAQSGVTDGHEINRELFHEVPVAVVPDASSPDAQRSTGHIHREKVVLRTADGGMREGGVYDAVLPAGPHNTCPRGYRYWQEIHVAGCVWDLGPDKKCPPGYRYDPRDRCVSYDASTDFDRRDAATKLGAVDLDPCLAFDGPDRLGDVWITFGEDGRAITTRVVPPFAGTALGTCIEERVRDVWGRAYKSGGPVIVSMGFFVKR